MPRGIDHLVLCVNDLEKGGALYEALGFTTTPQNEHPFGTGNRIVQLDGCFLEILSVINPELISEHDGAFFSFGAFNRDFLNAREGMSMLVLDSVDENADRAEFLANGLNVYNPFEFQRVAKTPTGDGPIVGFSLTFVDSPKLPGMAFFTCRQWRPDLFWKPELQQHKNSALGISKIYIVSQSAADTAQFLATFAGVDKFREAELGLEVGTARGVFVVQTEAQFRTTFPGDLLPDNSPNVFFAGFDISVGNLDDLRSTLELSGVKYNQDASRVWVSSETGLGSVVSFSQI